MTTDTAPEPAQLSAASTRLGTIARRLDAPDFNAQLGGTTTVGRLTHIVGLTMQAVGCHLGMGARCRIEARGQCVDAEVVGFNEGSTLLMPLHDVAGVEPGARVLPTGGDVGFPDVGQLRGRVVDGLGRPLDSKGEIHWVPQAVAPRLAALDRAPIDHELDVGVRAINGLLTVGRGQRMGLFAGSGVGKSVLLGMMSRYTTADVNVVALVGERGREVREFLDENLGVEGLARSIVVVSPADDPPLLRMKAAEFAMSAAELLREQGLHVLLLMDSLTRYAQAHREISLAIGEPPATKGYTPSVFAKLPRLVERAGNGRDGRGSITAFFTVLTEGDDQQDPIADAARAILDGHAVLSRALAEESHYPAIDVEMSISRLMPRIASLEHQALAGQLRRLMARYRKNEDLIAVGAYAPGSDPDTDRAISLMPRIRDYLQQQVNERCGSAEALGALEELLR